MYRWHEARAAKHYVDIWIIGADGSNDREILRQERVEGRHDVLPLIENPAWSPDGSLIAVKVRLPGSLCFVRPDGVVARCPDVRGTLGVFLDWTPDGRHIFHPGTVDGIAIVEVDETTWTLGRERVIHEGAVGRVQVSPDGSRIAYTSHKDPETGRNVGQVRLVDIDGSNERFLAEGREPCWSPDSRQIAFVEFDEAGRLGRALKVVDVDGSNPRVLLEHSGWINHPAWSPLLPAETATPASSWGEVKHRHQPR